MATQECHSLSWDLHWTLIYIDLYRSLSELLRENEISSWLGQGYEIRVE